MYKGIARCIWILLLSFMSLGVSLYGCGSGGGTDNPVTPPNNGNGSLNEKISPTVFITLPTGLRSHSTKAATIDIAGSASDDQNLSKVTWQNNRGGSGTATGTTEWSVSGVALEVGDNIITISAIDAAGNIGTDSIAVTYNPNLAFLSTPLANPDSIFVNEPTTVLLRIAIENNSALVGSSVKLLKIDSDNNIVETIAALADDGNVDNGDDIASDGVFSGRATFTENIEGAIRLRISADTAETTGTVTAYSEIFSLFVIAHLTDAEFSKAVSMPDETQQKYDELKAGDGEERAKTKTVEWLVTQPEVGQAGISESGTGIWYVLKSGVLGGIILNPEGTRGNSGSASAPERLLIRKESGNNSKTNSSDKSSLNGQSLRFSKAAAPNASKPTIGNKNVLIIAPFHTEFSQSGTSEAPDLENMFNNSSSATFPVTRIDDSAASVAAFKTLSNFGVVSIISHGDTFYNGLLSLWQDVFGWDWVGAQAIVLTGEIATVANKAAYEVDLKKGRLVIAGGYYAITPAFVTYYNKFSPDSLIHAGSCRGKFNDSLASAFLGSGAKTFTGYTGYVASSYAKNTAIAYFKSLLDGKTAGDAFNDVVTAHGANDGGSPPAFLRLVGNKDLIITEAGLINGLFEAGNINGWKGQGDVRIISQLGSLTPQEGVYMSIISTGLGSISDSNSAIEQTFRLPSDVTTLSFDYNVVSEEPMEFVGSEFDDQFEATVTRSTTVTTIAFESINTSLWTTVAGIDFDGGDSTTFMTGWKHITFDVSSLPAGESVTLKFNTFDKGDSIYDTAVLLDNVKLE